MKDAAPRRLGRGLAALLGDNPAAEASSAIGMVAVDLLEPSPFQPRGTIQDDDLQELVASIRAQGMLQPILARPDHHRPGRFQIVAGERRWRAARLAEITSIPCFIKDIPDNEASVAALVENLQRRDLNPIEEAEGFRRLIEDFGLTQEQLGTAIGKSRSHVANLLRLLALPPEVLGYVRDGTLTAGHARAALASPDPLRAADQMIARGMTVRQAEALASTGPETANSPPARRRNAVDSSNADIRAVEADLAEQLGLHVSISYNGKGGVVTLRYQNLDQLDHIVAKLGRS